MINPAISGGSALEDVPHYRAMDAVLNSVSGQLQIGYGRAGSAEPNTPMPNKSDPAIVPDPDVYEEAAGYSKHEGLEGGHAV
jgi:hypothetical protein